MRTSPAYYSDCVVVGNATLYSNLGVVGLASGITYVHTYILSKRRLVVTACMQLMCVHIFVSFFLKSQSLLLHRFFKCCPAANPTIFWDDAFNLFFDTQTMHIKSVTHSTALLCFS
jgi:hypothetical protein